MNGNWPQEALQAVAATYAIYKRENEKNGIYDLGDTHRRRRFTTALK